MKVHVTKGTRGGIVCRFGVFTGLFEEKSPQPELGQEIEVMILDALRPKIEHQLIKTFIVTPVTRNHVLVHHDGFRFMGQGRVLAELHAASKRELEACINGKIEIKGLTPGRTPVYDRENRSPPGRAYVDIGDLIRPYPRIAGVPHLDELSLNVRESLYRLPF